MTRPNSKLVNLLGPPKTFDHNYDQHARLRGRISLVFSLWWWAWVKHFLPLQHAHDATQLIAFVHSDRHCDSSQWVRSCLRTKTVWGPLTFSFFNCLFEGLNMLSNLLTNAAWDMVLGLLSPAPRPTKVSCGNDLKPTARPILNLELIFGDFHMLYL